MSKWREIREDDAFGKIIRSCSPTEAAIISRTVALLDPAGSDGSSPEKGVPVAGPSRSSSSMSIDKPEVAIVPVEQQALQPYKPELAIVPVEQEAPQPLAEPNDVEEDDEVGSDSDPFESFAEALRDLSKSLPVRAQPYKVITSRKLLAVDPADEELLAELEAQPPIIPRRKACRILIC